MSLIKHLLNENVNKSIIDNIKTIDDFIDVINNMDTTPQRGFSYKPKSANKIPKNHILMHTSTKQNIKSIISDKKFKGVSAYYSSFTKVRNKSKQYVKEGNFAFAFDTTNKKVDSRYTKGMLYGDWGILFTSDDAMSVYSTLDKQTQIIFDVNSNIDFKYVFNVKIDMNNLKELIYDIYDLDFNIFKKGIKLSKFLKEIK